MELDNSLRRIFKVLNSLLSLIRKLEQYSLSRAARSQLYPYGVALVVTSICLIVRIYLGHWIDGGPYILLIAGVLICALFAGATAGMVATVVMALAQLYFFSQPYLELSLSKLSGPDAFSIITFVVVAGMLNLLLWGRRSAKGVAAETEEQFKAAFNQAAVGMSYTDMEGRWIQVNPKYVHLMGYTQEELRQKTFSDLTHPDDLEGSRQLMRRLVDGEGHSFGQQKRYIRKDGSEFWADITVSLVKDTFGRPKYFVTVLQDITAKLEAEQKLRASEQEYRTIIETAEEGVWILDSSDTTKFVNNKMAEMMGYKAGELVGRSPIEFMDDLDKKVLRKHLELRHNGVSEQYDLKWKRKDGSALWTSISTTPMRTADGSYNGALAMISDISKRKQFEAKIEAEHKRIYGFFSAAPALIAILRGPDHRFEFANEVYKQSVGAERELIGKSVREALPELEGQHFFELLDHVYATGEPFVGTEMVARLIKGGVAEDRCFNFVYQAYRDDDGEIDGVFVHGIDVTDQVNTKTALIQNRERLELAQEAGNIGTFELNIATGDVIWSAQLESLYGLEPGTFGGKDKDWLELVVEEDRSLLEAVLRQTGYSGEDIEAEFRVNMPDGEVHWMAATGKSQYDNDGRLNRIVGINRDVNKRKRAEEGLKFLTKFSTVLASSLNYETTVRNVADLTVEELADWCAVDMIDDDGQVVRIAQSHSLRIEPRLAEKLERLHKLDLLAEGDVAQVLMSGKSVLCPKLKDEELERFFPEAERLAAAREIGISSIIRVPIQILGWAAGAITVALADPRRRYDNNDLVMVESLAERASAAIDNAWLYKETQKARQQLENRVDQRTLELVNKNAELNEAQKISHLGSWEWDVVSNERHWSDEMYRIYGVDPDSFVPTTESISPYTHPDDLGKTGDEARGAIDSVDGSFESEYRIVRADGSLRNLYAQGRVVKDASGKPIKMVGTVLDITDRKKVEQMKTDFVSLVSHQLKTPLAIIKGYTDNILMGIAGDLNDKQRQYLREMQEITTKYYYLIADLLNVSRIERGVISFDRRPADLIDVVKAAVAGHTERIKSKGLKLEMELSKKPIRVFVDGPKLAEAFSNVIDNAIKFTAEGKIKVALTSRAEQAWVEISDSGKGMSPELMAKLFLKDQIFSGGPSPEGGSGLGLYIAKEFIKHQGGDVGVTSVVGRGSKFTFNVPLAKVKLGVK